MSGHGAARAVTHFCSRGKVLFGRRVGTGGGANQANLHTLVRAARADGHLRASVPHAGEAQRGVGVHGPRVANSAQRREGRHQFTDGGFA